LSFQWSFNGTPVVGQTNHFLTLVGVQRAQDGEYAVTVGNAFGAATARARLTVMDCEPQVSISITDTAVTEGNTGITNLVFEVRLSQPATAPVTVRYTSADDLAMAGEDYVTATGTLTFYPGETNKSIAVTVIGDRLPEADETLWLNLSQAVNATIADGQGVGTIADDDPALLSINNVRVVEGTGSMTNAVFTVILVPASAQEVMVGFETAGDTALNGVDFIAANGTLTFQPGQTNKTFQVQVMGDALDEPDEQFLVNLTWSLNAIITQGQGLGTILDNDPAPCLSIGDATVQEGDTGATNAALTVRLDVPACERVTIQYATVEGTARAGTDYTGVSGTLIFEAGETNKAVLVPVLGDRVHETNEMFRVELSNPVGAELCVGQAVCTISDNDQDVTVSISDAMKVTEGNSGIVNALFPVSLSWPSSQPVTLDYATANGTATAGSDYTARTDQLIFNPGATNQTIAVEVRGDLLDEDDETFSVSLSNVVGAVLGRAQAVGTILDDDALPTLSITDKSVLEGNSGMNMAGFTVRLSMASGRVVTVDCGTADGSATVGDNDYRAASGTLSFAPGDTVKTVLVPIVGDTKFEADEQFWVRLNNPVNALISRAEGAGEIRNEDILAWAAELGERPAGFRCALDDAHY
jgi:hypothetical protein